MLNLYVKQSPKSAEISIVFKASRKYLYAGLFFFMTLSFIFILNSAFKNVQFIYEVNITRLIRLSRFNATKKIFKLGYFLLAQEQNSHHQTVNNFIATITGFTDCF